MLLQCAMRVLTRRVIGAARHAEIARRAMETGSCHDPEADDDVCVIAATGYVLVQIKMTKLPNSRIERFLQTRVRDTLSEVKASSSDEADISRFNVAVG